MRNGDVMDIPPEHTTTLVGIASAVLTGIGMIFAGFFKSKQVQKQIEVERIRIEAERRADENAHERGMTKEQREWVESLWKQMRDLNETTDGMRKQLEGERETYEKKIEELRQGYRQELEQQEQDCRTEIGKLQTQVDRLKNERKLWMPDIHACVQPKAPDDGQ